METCCFGPGSLEQQPAVLDAEKRMLLYRAYEVYPKHHEWEGMRVFERVCWELRKGVAKTEFGSWVCFAELHPEAPVRFNGFAKDGTLLEGKPVVSPFIPMLATTEGQVQELAYGVLKYVVEHSVDADLFDIGLDRIIRLGGLGENAGEAKAVANAPGPRDGARTTFQHFDEPHRVFLPLARQAVETMLANMGKRILEQPWTLSTSTAGKPGQGSVEEDFRAEAEKIKAGKLDNPRFFFFARWAGPEHKKLDTVERRVAAISDATGPIGEFGKGQFDRIARDYDRVGMDRAFWEQVYLNRWRKSESQTFDMTKVKTLPGVAIPRGNFICAGMDGARRRDSTGIVITDIDSGQQQLVGLWERPDFPDTDEGREIGANWQVDETLVTGTVSMLREDYELWQIWADPPYWTDTVASWATLWPDQVMEFWTNQQRRMAFAIRAYVEALENGSCVVVGFEAQVEDMLRHMGSAGKVDLNLFDDQGKPLSIMGKMEGRLSEKFDAAMAGCISWTACLEARRKGVRPAPKVGMPRRIR